MNNDTQRRNALKALKRKLGARVHTDDTTCYRASFDGSKLSFIPEAVVCVDTEHQVGDLLTLANKYRIPVTTRGAGSSLTGSASPLRGGWVLDVSKLKKIRIDKNGGFVTAQTGAVVGKIQKAAERVGWFYPPDPSSSKFCTIGGTIACNAGGLRGAKYGVTRDYVVALRGFLPTGEAVSFGRPLRKWAVGYNLRDLWIGSEGTLGVITEATLRLIPKPDKRCTALAAFDNEAAALKAVQVLLKNRLLPVALEFLDRSSVISLEKATGSPVFAQYPGSALLLVELDGDNSQVRVQKNALRQWSKQTAKAFREAKGDKEAELIWDVRRGCSPAMFALGDSKLNEDIIVPQKSQIPLMRFIQQLRKETDLHMPTFGHAADGNFHVNIMYNRSDAKQCKRAKKAVKMLMEKVVDLGGAISGEHGIGLAKTPFLRYQYGKAEIQAMQAVKQSLDPQGILNPGKIFEPFEVWNHTPVKTRLPWDHRPLEG